MRGLTQNQIVKSMFEIELIMKKTSNLLENIIHGIFLILGLITVGCVLTITVYLVISGIPAIREIGL